MTQEEKKLLVKDLCARLPYYTELYSNVADDNWAILTPVVISNLMNADKDLVIKPYLRLMLSMTEDEERELEETLQYTQYTLESYDWLLAHHFDFRDLIEKGLALEAKSEMYKI